MAQQLTYVQMRDIPAKLFNVCVPFVDGTLIDDELHDYFPSTSYNTYLDLHCDEPAIFDAARYAVHRAHMQVHCSCSMCYFVWE
jgi:hypothetical protein